MTDKHPGTLVLCHKSHTSAATVTSRGERGGGSTHSKWADIIPLNVELSHFIISRFSNVCWALMTSANENACLNFHPSLHILIFSRLLLFLFYPCHPYLPDGRSGGRLPMIRSGLMSGRPPALLNGKRRGRRERLETHLHTLRVISAAISGRRPDPVNNAFQAFSFQLGGRPRSGRASSKRY